MNLDDTHSSFSFPLSITFGSFDCNHFMILMIIYSNQVSLLEKVNIQQNHFLHRIKFASACWRYFNWHAYFTLNWYENWFATLNTNEIQGINCNMLIYIFHYYCLGIQQTKSNKGENLLKRRKSKWANSMNAYSMIA